LSEKINEQSFTLQRKDKNQFVAIFSKQKTEKREKGSDKTGALLIFRESRQFVKQHLVEVKKKLIFHYINSNIL
jgi:hypothetical protein